MSEYVFRRNEEKYLIDKTMMDKILKKIDKYIEKDVYFKSNILNLYFDNVGNELINKSINRPLYKIKVRVRSYVVPKKNDIVFFELKTKFKGMVGKRRAEISLGELENYIKKGKFKKNSQILKEIDYFVKMYGLKPSIFIAYDRLSYKGIDESNYLRITFDSNLRSRRDNLKLDYSSDDKYYDKDMVIMEVKTLDAMPKWLVDVLSEFKVYPTSFSKYGKIYVKEIEESYLC